MSKPWEDKHSIWKNEAQFMNWMRGQIRQIWKNHPIRNGYLDEKTEKKPLGRITVNNPDGQMVNAIPCEECGTWVKKSKPKGQRYAEYAVDHIHGGKGFSSKEEFFEWVTTQLWVTSEDIRTLCVPCHEIVNIMQSHNLTWGEAVIEKKLIAIMNTKAKGQRDFLLQHGMEESKMGKNEEIRKQQIREILEGKL